MWEALYAIQIGSNWCMDTGVRAFLRLILHDLYSKDLSNRPIYAVLNTHNLDIILQLKYMSGFMKTVLKSLLSARYQSFSLVFINPKQP